MSEITAKDIFDLIDRFRSPHGPTQKELRDFLLRPEGPRMPSSHHVLSSEWVGGALCGTDRKGHVIPGLEKCLVSQLSVDPEGVPAYVTITGGYLCVWHGGNQYVPCKSSRAEFEDLSRLTIVGFEETSKGFVPVMALKEFDAGTISVNKLRIFIGKEESEEPDNMVGYYRLWNGRIFRVIAHGRSRMERGREFVTYSVTRDHKEIHHFEGGDKVNGVGEDSQGNIWIRHGIYKVLDLERLSSCGLTVDLISTSRGVTQVKCVSRDNRDFVGRYVQKEGELKHDSFRSSKLPYKRCMNDATHGSFAYVARLKDGFETWVHESQHGMLVGSPWDYVSPLFQRRIAGVQISEVCYYAVAGEYLYKVAFRKEPIGFPLD